MGISSPTIPQLYIMTFLILNTRNLHPWNFKTVQSRSHGSIYRWFCWCGILVSKNKINKNIGSTIKWDEKNVEPTYLISSFFLFSFLSLHFSSPFLSNLLDVQLVENGLGARSPATAALLRRLGARHRRRPAPLRRPPPTAWQRKNKKRREKRKEKKKNKKEEEKGGKNRCGSALFFSY